MVCNVKKGWVNRPFCVFCTERKVFQVRKGEMKMQNIWIYDTEMGKISIAENGEGITRLTFGDVLKPDRYEAKETPLIREAARQLAEYFEEKRRTFDFPLSLKGTDFEKRSGTPCLLSRMGKREATATSPRRSGTRRPAVRSEERTGRTALR